MAHMIIRHKVKDFGKWKNAFDEHRPVREAAGLEDLHVWRNIDDPNEVIILFCADELGKARDFAGDSGLKEKMQAAGVQGMPEFVYLDEA